MGGRSGEGWVGGWGGGGGEVGRKFEGFILFFFSILFYSYLTSLSTIFLTVPGESELSAHF